MEALTIVTVGFESHSALAVRRGVAIYARDAGVPVCWEPIERRLLADADGRARVALALQGADVVLVQGVHDVVDADVLAGLVDDAGPVDLVPVPPDAEPILARARLGDFDAAGESAPALFRRVAAAAAAAGHPAVPQGTGILQGIGGLGPDALAGTGDLRHLAQVVESFHQLTPGNVAHALRVLAHVLRPDEQDDPGWPEAVAQRGFWHPAVGVRVSWEEYRGAVAAALGERETCGRVVLTCFPTQVTSGNDAHLRALVDALERRGLDVVGWLGTVEDVPGSDGVGAVPDVGVFLNATGFTLSGSHGQPNIAADIDLLTARDASHLAVVPLFTQTLQQWRESVIGLTPVQVAMQVAVPELEGGVASLVFAGRDERSDAIVPVDDHVERIAGLAARTAELRRTPAADKRIALVIFGYPPDGGSIGSAAHLDVWASLHHTLLRLRGAGYTVEVPDTPQALLDAVVSDQGGGRHSATRVLDRYPAGQYVHDAGTDAERVSRFWGRPPGEVDSDGTAIDIHGARFGNVVVVAQPSFGYEGDPMALLFTPDASPSHSFTAFYTWVRTVLDPHAVVHIGTHGALEFMPGKQAGLDPRDWSSLLVGEVPHFYLYCINNPSEGSIAKRRSNATLVSYLTPPLDRAGLYGTLSELGDEIREARAAAAGGEDIARRLGAVRALAEKAELRLDAASGPEDYLAAVAHAVDEIERTLIPIGMHVLDAGIDSDEAVTTLRVAADHDRPDRGLPALTAELETALTSGVELADLPGDDAGRRRVEALLDDVVTAVLHDGEPPALPVADRVRAGWVAFLREMRDLLGTNDEVGALLRALDGGFVRPGPGGEPSRRLETLPTGRNLHALDPQRVPTTAATHRGRALAEALLERACAEAGRLPETVAIVLWGIDNVKNGGEGVGQLLALLGVEPLPDSSGKVDRFRLLPLHELGRPRIDVVATMSGIFRDLFPTTIDLMDRAIRAVATADEPPELNFLRAHALAQAAELGIDLGEAATRLWSAPAGQYGAGVNHVVDASAWDCEEDLAEVFVRRMGYAWGRGGGGEQREQLLRSCLSSATVAFQNIDSAETSLADVDHYYEYLGGLTAAISHTSGRRPDTFVADSYAARPRPQSLQDAMRLESRTRLLNPRWYEAQLAHGYQGVHAVTTRLENTFGMQATTGAVDGWIFTQAARTFLFDDELRTRMERQNPMATKRFADRLVEARERELWLPEAKDSERLDQIADHLDDVAEGVA